MILRSIMLCCVTFCTTLLADDATSWTLTGCAGKQVGDIFEVTGTGQDHGGWYSAPLRVSDDGTATLVPRGMYRFSVEASSLTGGGGCAPIGFSELIHCISSVSTTPQTFSYIARLPDGQGNITLRLGQWESQQTYQFRNPTLQQVVPLFRRIVSRDEKNSINLGDGEMIVGGVYTFTGDLSGEGSYAHRPLETMRCGFNTNRFTFGSDNEVVYNFAIAPTSGEAIPFKLATWEISCCHYVSGECIVEASRDGAAWTQVGTLNKIGSITATIPESLFPAQSLKVRLRTGSGASLQIDNTRFAATLENTSFEGVGETVWGDVIPKTGDAGLFDATEATIAARLVFDETRSTQDAPHRINFPQHRVEYKVPFSPYRDTVFGHRLASENLWWCEADWKVAPQSVAEDRAAPIVIAAAKNDVESFQIVVAASPRPRKLAVALDGELRNGTATIPRDCVSLRWAYYHFVHRKTDVDGIIGDVPDALPPLDAPLELAANRNQPLWVTVAVPHDAVAGLYNGSLTVTLTDGDVVTTEKVPFSIRVWNFTLPRTNTLDTAYGMNSRMIFQYHNAKTEAEQRAVLDLYFENFAAHRISPYNLAPLDPYKVAWLPNADPPQCRLDFARFDTAMERVFEKFGFTQFKLDVYGLGDGTFHARAEPSIVGFGFDTPQYQAMHRDYLTKLQTHLEEKGWLDKAYVYWFDEPDPKDYEFVARNLKQLQAHAPKLRRMMTEEPNAAFVKTLADIGTSINIWCPVSENFSEATAKPRMANGEKFWWYVCTGPKSPYCTLFIDHAATSLRAWHWQTWQRGIGGTLVWESTYWTSDAAFPDSPQNPYLDPMGYVSGYSTPRGTKLFWGNGDGRFVYPPLEAAVPGMNDGKFVLKPPVSSIRWEMIREGVEDYEMLSLLRKWYTANAASLTPEQKSRCETLLTVPREITASMTEWTPRAEPIHKHRREVGEFLESVAW